MRVTLPVFTKELIFNAPVDDITPSTVNVYPLAASNSPVPVITTPREDCNSTEPLANNVPPLNVKPLALAPKLLSALIDKVPDVSVVPPVKVFAALSVVTPPPLIVTLPPPNGALTVTGFAAVLLNVNALLLSVPAPVIVPDETLTAPTESALLIKSVPPLTLTVLVDGMVLTAPTSSVPADTVVEPLYVFAPESVVVPAPLCTRAVVAPAPGVPKGALTTICVPSALVKLKFVLDNVPAPVIEPLDALTAATVLL